MSGAHARLSASSAHRWLACAGSVAPGGESSSYAATGTFAHGIAAECLEKGAPPSDFLLKEGVVDGHKVVCDLEMVEVIEEYIEVIKTDHCDGDKGYIEMSLLDVLKTIDKDLGGTADYVRYRPSNKTLRVIDFKYGSGMYVEACSNEQLMLYAIGAMLYVNQPVEQVEVTIVQPRFEGAKPVRNWIFEAFTIMEFIADVKTAAEKTRLDNPPLVAGEHCKFCPKARTCPELEKRQHAIIAADFGAVHAVTGKVDMAAFAKVLESVPLVKERIKAIEEFAYTQATAGVEVPGFKLVDKLARRSWKSEGDVIEWAQKEKVDAYAPRELLSVAQLEKKLGENAPRGKKKEAGKVLEPFVQKISSGTALVPISDDRPPAKRITADDFAALK